MSTHPLGPYGRPLQPGADVPTPLVPVPVPAPAPTPASGVPTSERRGPQQAPPTGGDATVVLTVDRSTMVGAGVVAASIAGALGPWITLGVFSRSGVDAGEDALIAMALGVLGGLLIARKRSRVLTAVIGVLLAGLAVLHIQDISGLGDELLSPSPGWGLYLVGIVGVVLVLSAFAKRPATAPPAIGSRAITGNGPDVETIAAAWELETD